MEKPAKLRPAASINVTPLVDVVLVLLIIFMLVTPLIHSGFDAVLPPSGPAEAPPPAPTRAIVVAMTADGALTVDGKSIPPEALGQRIRSLVESGRPEPVLFQGDRGAGWEATARVLDTIVRAEPGRRLKIGIVFPAEG